MSKKGIRFLSMLLSASMALSMPAVPALASEQMPEKFTESVSSVASSGLRVASGINGEWDDGALFEEYIRSMFYGEPSKNKLRGISVEKSTLNDTEKWLYGKLKAEIEKIARGERTDTKIEINTSEKSDIFSWTPTQCGLESFTEDNVSNAIKDRIPGIIDSGKVWRCLLSDLPYDFYWHDKTVGMSFGYSISFDSKKATVPTITMSFSVNQKYAKQDVKYATNLDQSENLSRAKTAAENAQAIVKKYSSETDYNKLYGYMKEICDLNTYNTAATEEGYYKSDQDPWQMIYVFDGDQNTNVVCEGYSKAFAYLCDQTSFNNQKIKCYIVSGVMGGGTGAGGHMWNVVTMDDGKNYLIDVTNCDGNAVGNPDLLFLAGLPGSVNDKYTFIKNELNKVYYTYDEKMCDLYGTDAGSILTLAATEGNTLYYRPSGNAVVRVITGSNSTEYSNITEALNASEGKDFAIELLADISTSGVSMTGTATIDLNGHTWNNEGDMSFTSLVLRDSAKNSTGKVKSAAMYAGSLEMTSGTVDASVSVTENGKAVISGGKITNLLFGSNAAGSIRGGSFGTIQTADQSMQSLLEANYAYYKTNAGNWAAGTELSGTSLSGVEVKAAPLTSLRVNGTTEQHTGYDAFNLTADATMADGVAGTPVYLWEMVDSDGNANKLTGGDSANGGTLMVAVGKTAGNYTYRVTATADGYSISQDVTVSIALTQGELSINPSYVSNYTYGQSVAVPKDSDITTNINSADRKLEYIWYTGDYSEAELPPTGGTTEIPSAVGVYTLVVKVTGNGYSPASTKKLVTISRAVLTDEQIKSLVSIPVSKIYDRAPAVAVSVPDRMTGIGTITVWYQNKQDGNGIYNDVAPVNSGTYDVYIDVTEGTCYEAVAKKKIGSFTISQAALTADMFARIPDQIYTGKLIMPEVESSTLAAGDFTVGISSADSGIDSTGSSAGIKAGIVTLTITAKPGTDYTGSITKDYRICQAKPIVTDVRCTNQEKLAPTQSPKDAVLSCTAKVGEIDVDGVISLTDAKFLAGENQYTWKFTPSDTRNYQEVTGEIKISLLVEEKPTQAGNLSYSFGNSRSAFNYPSNYRIPLEIYENIWGKTVMAQTMYKKAGTWGGSCYGMAATSGIFNTEDSGVKIGSFRSGAGKVCELQLDDKNSDRKINVRQFIETMFVSQRDSLIQRTYFKNMNVLSKLCELAQTENELVLIAVFGKEGGHALLGYRLEDVDDMTAKLYVYDPNFPLQERYISLTKDGVGNYTGWYYHLNDRYDWGSEYKGSISYVPYDTYVSLWNNSTLKRDATMNLLYINTSNASIKDANGKEIAKLVNNQLQTDQNNIIQVKDTGMTSDNEKSGTPNLIYLPTDTYMIQNLDTDEENFDVSLVNSDFGVQATTTADEVTVYADDESKSSSVSILAKPGEAYEIKLENSAGDDYHTVQITGKGKGQAVGAELNHGLVSLTNCSEDQMSVKENSSTGTYYTIKTEAEGEGTISPSGTYYAVPGSSVTFIMRAADGYKLEDVLVDGRSIGAVDQYVLDKISSDCKILAKFEPDEKHVLIENIKLNITSTSVQDKGNMKLEVTVIPENASTQKLKWSSEDPKVATVDNQGIVTAVGVGKTIITVGTTDGSNKKASCVVTVTAKPDDGGNSGGGSSGGGSSSGSGSSSGGNSGNGGSSGGDSGLVINLSYYIVSFNANGGKNLSRKTMTLLMDDSLGILPKVQRENYRFKGWYTEKTGGKKVTSATVLNASTILYAHWEKL